MIYDLNISIYIEIAPNLGYVVVAIPFQIEDTITYLNPTQVSDKTIEELTRDIVQAKLIANPGAYIKEYNIHHDNAEAPVKIRFDSQGTTTTDGGAYIYAYCLSAGAKPLIPANFIGVLSDDRSKIIWSWSNLSNENGYRILDEADAIIATLNAGIDKWEEPAAIGMTYRRIVAYNSYGVSDSSNLVNMYISDYLNSPENFRGYVLNSSTIQWIWEKEADPEIVFEIVDEGENLIASVPAKGFSFTESNLIPQSSYIRKIKAIKGTVESTFTELVTVTTPAQGEEIVPVPTEFSISICDYNSLELFWEYDEFIQIEGFYLCGENGAILRQLPPDARYYRVINLIEGSQYSYTLRAFNNIASDPSGIATAILPVKSDIPNYEPKIYPLKPYYRPQGVIKTFQSGVGDGLDLYVKDITHNSLGSEFDVFLDIIDWQTRGFDYYPPYEVDYRFWTRGYTYEQVNTQSYELQLVSYPIAEGELAAHGELRDEFTVPVKITADIAYEDCQPKTLEYLVNIEFDEVWIDGSVIHRNKSYPATITDVYEWRNFEQPSGSLGYKLVFDRPLDRIIQEDFTPLGQVTNKWVSANPGVVTYIGSDGYIYSYMTMWYSTCQQSLTFDWSVDFSADLTLTSGQDVIESFTQGINCRLEEMITSIPSGLGTFVDDSSNTLIHWIPDGTTSIEFDLIYQHHSNVEFRDFKLDILGHGIYGDDITITKAWPNITCNITHTKKEGEDWKPFALPNIAREIKVHVKLERTPEDAQNYTTILGKITVIRGGIKKLSYSNLGPFSSSITYCGQPYKLTYYPIEEYIRYELAKEGVIFEVSQLSNKSIALNYTASSIELSLDEQNCVTCTTTIQASHPVMRYKTIEIGEITVTVTPESNQENPIVATDQTVYSMLLDKIKSLDTYYLNWRPLKYSFGVAGARWEKEHTHIETLQPNSNNTSWSIQESTQVKVWYKGNGFYGADINKQFNTIDNGEEMVVIDDIALYNLQGEIYKGANKPTISANIISNNNIAKLSWKLGEEYIPIENSITGWPRAVLINFREPVYKNITGIDKPIDIYTYSISSLMPQGIIRAYIPKGIGLIYYLNDTNTYIPNYDTWFELNYSDSILIEVFGNSISRQKTKYTDWMYGIVNGKEPYDKEGSGWNPLHVICQALVPEENWVGISYGIECLQTNNLLKVKWDNGVKDNGQPITIFYHDLGHKTTSRERVVTGTIARKVIPGPASGGAISWTGGWIDIPIPNTGDFEVTARASDPNINLEIKIIKEEDKTRVKLLPKTVLPGIGHWKPLVKCGYYYLNDQEHYLFADNQPQARPIKKRQPREREVNYKILFSSVGYSKEINDLITDKCTGTLLGGAIRKSDGSITIKTDENNEYISGNYLSNWIEINRDITLWRYIEALGNINISNAVISVRNKRGNTIENWQEVENGSTPLDKPGERVQFKVELMPGAIEVEKETTITWDSEQDFSSCDTINAHYGPGYLIPKDPSKEVVILSPVIDIQVEKIIQFNAIIVNSYIPPGSVFKLYTITSDDLNGPWDGTGEPLIPVDLNTGIILSAIKRFFRWKVIINKGTAQGTPVLNSMLLKLTGRIQEISIPNLAGMVAHLCRPEGEYPIYHKLDQKAVIPMDGKYHPISSRSVRDMVSSYLLANNIDLEVLGPSTSFEISGPGQFIFEFDPSGKGPIGIASAAIEEESVIVSDKFILDEHHEVECYPVPQQHAPVIIYDDRRYPLRQVFFTDKDGKPTLVNTEILYGNGSYYVELGYLDIDSDNLVVDYDTTGLANWEKVNNVLLKDNHLVLPFALQKDKRIRVQYSLIASFFVDYNYKSQEGWAKIRVYDPHTETGEIKVFYETSSTTPYYTADEVNLNPTMSVEEGRFVFISNETPKVVRLEIYCSPDTLINNGYDCASIFVIARDKYGNAVPYVDLVLSADIGSLHDIYLRTNYNGVVHTMYTVPQEPLDKKILISAYAEDISAVKEIELLDENQAKRLAVQASFDNNVIVIIATGQDYDYSPLSGEIQLTCNEFTTTLPLANGRAISTLDWQESWKDPVIIEVATEGLKVETIARRGE